MQAPRGPGRKETDMIRTTILATVILTLTAGPLWAEEAEAPQAAPATETNEQAAGDDDGQVTVVSVEGVVQKREANEPDGDWQPVKVGEALDDLTILRTGLGSTATLKFGDRGEFVVRSGTKVGIGEFKKEGKFAKARLGLKYGSVKASIDPSRGPNDFRVTTAVATLSVRGSGGSAAFDGVNGFNFDGDTGHFNVSSGSGDMNLTGNQGTNGNLDLPGGLANQNRSPNMGSTSGMGGTEGNNLLNNGGGRGIFGFGNGNGNGGGGTTTIGGTVGTSPRTDTSSSSGSASNGGSHDNGGSITNGYDY